MQRVAVVQRPATKGLDEMYGTGFRSGRLTNVQTDDNVAHVRILLDKDCILMHYSSCKASYTLIAEYAKTIAKNKKRIAAYFVSLFSRPFFYFSHFAAFCTRSAFAGKVKGFRGLFFRGINKTRNLHEIRKMHSECFVFCGVFRENIRKISMKYEKCLAGLTLN